MSRRLPEELEEEIILVLEQITKNSIQNTRCFLDNPGISRGLIDTLLQDDFITLFELLQQIRTINNNQWTWPRSS